MKRKTRDFIQHLSHDLDEDDEGRAQQLLEESLPLVGLVVMYFNRLEKAIDSAICGAISDRSDSTGLLVIHGMQYTSKVDLYKRLCNDLHGSEADGVTSYGHLIDRLTEVGKLRNLVVHADWDNTDAEGYTYVRLRLTKRGMKQEYVQFTLESMEKVIEQIQAVHEQFDQYLSDCENFLRNA